MKELYTIYLDSVVNERDKIFYVDLNVPANFQLTISRAAGKDRNRVDLESANGKFDGKTYYLSDHELDTDSGHMFFFDVYTYVCQFVEWFERKDVVVRFDRHDVVSLLEEAIANRQIKDCIYY